MGLLVRLTLSSPVRYLVISAVCSITSSVHFIMRYPMCSILTCSVVITRYFPLYVPLRPPCIHALPYVYHTNLFCRDYPYGLCIPSSSNSQTNPGPTLNLGWIVPLGWRPSVCKTSHAFPQVNCMLRCRLPKGFFARFLRPSVWVPSPFSLHSLACQLCQAFRSVFPCIP